MDATFDQANLESISAAKTCCLVETPTVASVLTGPTSPDAPDPADPNAPEARAFSDVNRLMSQRYNALPKVVVSDRGPVASDNPWAHTTTVIPRAQAARWVTVSNCFLTRSTWS